MRGKMSRGRALSNAAIMLMMVALYITITIPDAKSAISELYNSPVYRTHKKGVVALEIAVSWNAQALEPMLELLAKRDLRVTFLVSGDWAEENAELLKRMAKEGHEIGTMGNTPSYDGKADSVTQDVKLSVERIQGITGIKPALYYSGTRDIRASSAAASRLGLTHVLCTVDLLSGRGSFEDIVARALDEPFDGSIILIQPTQEALKALPRCLDGLSGQGLRVCTVSEAL